MRMFPTIAVCLAACTVPPAVPIADADWPQFRGTRGDGVSTETGWSERFGDGAPRVAWERRIGVGYASVSVADGRLYTAGWSEGDGTIHCLDAVSGDEIWAHRYPIARYDRQHKGGPAGTPATHDGRVYALTRDAELLCLDAAKGGVLWSRRLMDEFGVEHPRFAFTGSPVVHGDHVYVDAGCIAAFDKATGAPVWRTKNYGPAYSTPVPFEVDGRSLIAAFPREGAVVLDRATGAEHGMHPWLNPYGNNAVVPVIDGRRVLVSSGDDVGAVMLEVTDDGLDVIWESRKFRNKMATSVLLDGHLYGFDVAVLRCLDVRDGTAKWAQRGLGKGTLMAAGDRLIVLTEDGELVTARATPTAFEVLDRAKVLDAGQCWTVPVLSNGRIYCRGADGQLVCVDVRGRGKGRN